jgi:hypothetical protein
MQITNLEEPYLQRFAFLKLLLLFTGMVDFCSFLTFDKSSGINNYSFVSSFIRKRFFAQRAEKLHFLPEYLLCSFYVFCKTPDYEISKLNPIQK